MSMGKEFREFAVKGTAQDYQFQLVADLQGPDIPKGHWTLDGQGSDQAALIGDAGV